MFSGSYTDLLKGVEIKPSSCAQVVIALVAELWKEYGISLSKVLLYISKLSLGSSSTITSDSVMETLPNDVVIKSSDALLNVEELLMTLAVLVGVKFECVLYNGLLKEVDARNGFEICEE